MMNRQTIIDKVKQCLEPYKYINALWLEGSDGNDSLDEYSDIDIWIDVDDDMVEEAFRLVENIFEELGGLDYKYDMKHGHPKLRQRIYHIKNTSKYLMIDFCLQLNSRDKDEYTYVEGDQIEAVKVLFDKDNIIRYKKLKKSEYAEDNLADLEECKYRFSQIDRVEKYIKREQYCEAYAYYNRYIVESLTKLIRLKYTPTHTDYYMVHISSHIPHVELTKLESFIKVSSLNDINKQLPLALKWYNELVEDFRNSRN